MGLILSTTKFAYPAPRPEAIARQASEICGLPIRYQASEHPLKDVHEFSGAFFFEAEPGEKIELHAYQQGAVKRFEKEAGLPDHPALLKTQGYTDDHGVQRVYMHTFFGREPTLFHVIELALLKLGGTAEEPNDQLVEYDRVITPGELQERFRANRAMHRKNRPWYVLYGVFVVLTIPFHLLWSFVRLPFELFRLRRKHPDLFKKPRR